MNMSKLVAIYPLLLVAIVTTACSSKQATFVAAPQDINKGAVVYIYRPSSSTNFMMSPTVVIDDNEKFKIGSGDYRYVYLQGGNHTVGLNPADQYSTDVPVTINVEADKSYYLRVNTSLKFQPEQMNTRKFWIDVVAETEALTEIADTEYSGPEREQAADMRTGDSETDDGFSVDKTQDPFAGKY
jgi:hypothetical protein